MYDQLSTADLRQLFNYSLVLNHGRLLFLKGYEAGEFSAVDLEYQQEVDIPKEDFFFKPIDRHLGMVNSDYGCGFVSRRVIRQFSIGLTRDNITVSSLFPGVTDHIRNLRLKGIVNSYRNQYPDVGAAFESAKKIKQPIAFDKSFALGPDGLIYYRKMKIVGIYKQGVLKFNKGFEFLEQRIGDSRGKNYREV